MVSAAEWDSAKWPLLTDADYPFHDMETAYATFKAAADNKALKMLITM